MLRIGKREAALLVAMSLGAAGQSGDGCVEPAELVALAEPE